MCLRRREAAAAALRLAAVALLQQLDHHIVELDEAHVEALGAAAQVGHAQDPWIDASRPSFDLLGQEQGVVERMEAMRREFWLFLVKSKAGQGPKRFTAFNFYARFCAASLSLSIGPSGELP